MLVEPLLNHHCGCFYKCSNFSFLFVCQQCRKSGHNTSTLQRKETVSWSKLSPNTKVYKTCMFQAFCISASVVEDNTLALGLNKVTGNFVVLTSGENKSPVYQPASSHLNKKPMSKPK